MENSSADMYCVLKVKTECRDCKRKVMEILRGIRGVYNVTIDGEEGSVRVTGRVNPGTLLSVLDGYGEHAEVKYVKFDGEVVERNPNYYYYYGEYYPYALSYPPPQFPPQQQWYNPYQPPPLALYPQPPPATFWPTMQRHGYGPPPVWAARPHPPNNFSTGETSNQNKENQCALM